MKFVKINDEYIDYLYQFDTKVPYNKRNDVKGEFRPYIGVVLKINNHQYFAPLSSKTKNCNDFTTIKIKEDNLGSIKLNNMIPVTSIAIDNIDYSLLNKNKRNLLYKQLRAVRKKELKKKIQNNAKRIYLGVTINKNQSLINICCDYKLLEKECRNFQLSQNKSSKLNTKLNAKLQAVAQKISLKKQQNKPNISTNINLNQKKFNIK